MGCPPTLTLFGRETTEEEREDYRAQVDAYLKEPQPHPDDGYPSMREAEDARAAFLAKYPLLDIHIILPYDPSREKRLRARRILAQLTALEDRYLPDPIPESEQPDADAMLAELEVIEAELDREAEQWRRASVLSRLNAVSQATIDAYTKAFGPDKAPDMYWAMKQGC
jgi:hypothetical protein